MADEQKKSDHQPVFENGIITPIGRVSYPCLVRPDDKGQYSTKKYKITLVVPKDDAKIAALKAAILKCAKAAFPKKKIESLKDIQHPLKNGDKSDEEMYHGHIYFQAKRNPDKGKASCFDINKQNIDPIEIYGGCFARLKVSAMSYVGTEKIKNPETGELEVIKVEGVTFLLDGVQKTADGDRIGGGGGATASDFDDPVEDAKPNDDL